MAFPQTPLPLKVELDVAGTWTDITTKAYNRDGIQIVRGRQDEGSDVNPTTCQLTLNNRDGRFSPRNPTGAYYGLINRNSRLRVSIVETASWLQINQATGTTVTPTHVSTPDNAALDITGDIDIRFDADLDSWRDSMELVSKWTETGNQRSYDFFLSATGRLFLSHSTDGTTVLTASSSQPVPITNGRLAVRVVLDVDAGGGNRSRTFYYASTIAGPWTQLGTVQLAAGVTSIFSGSAPCRILDNPDSVFAGSTVRGRVYGAQILNGIAGSAVANPDFTTQTQGATSFADAAGRTWTLTGDLLLTHLNTRFIGEVTSWPQKWDISGRDIYTPAQANGLLRRLLQGSPLGSSLYRGTVRNPNVVAYWPMEDGENATTFGSGVPGGKAMKASATTVMSSDADFPCSQPIALIGASPLRGTVQSYVGGGLITLQFLIHVPTGGLTASSTIICSIACANQANPTIQTSRWDVMYGTGSGGTISLRAHDADGAVLATYGPLAAGMDGALKMVKVTLQNNVTIGVDSTVTVYNVGGALPGTMANTLALARVGRVTSVTVNPSSVVDYAGVALGHLAIFNTVNDVWSVFNQVSAWSGESATDRVKRLCEEEGVAFCPIGPRLAGDSVAMGYQTNDTLIALLRQCADADMGVLFEGREFLELRYRPGHALYSQRPDVTLDYVNHSMDALEPVEDDQLTRNDVTVQRINGASAREERTTGPLSTQAPPAGVGRYDTSYSVSLENDTTLEDQAGFRLRLGTVDEARFPQLAVSLESPHFSGIEDAIERLDLGDTLGIDNQPTWMAQTDIVQMVQGYSEDLNTFRHGFTFNLSPGSPWDVGVYDDPYARARYGNGDCTITSALTTTATSVPVLTGAGGERWSATAVPYNVIVAGEIMTVTAVTGATKTQTLTVTRSVNGVVKTQASGAAIELYPLFYYGL